MRPVMLTFYPAVCPTQPPVLPICPLNPNPFAPVQYVRGCY